MNLTDNEIIKALECCSKSNSNEEYCEDCPFKDTTSAYCIDLNIKSALDLINRKDKALKLSAKEIVDLKIKVKQQKAEIEKYDNIKTTIHKFWDILLKLSLAKRKEKPTLEEMAEAITEIEAEAIKEFAKRLKKKSQKYPYYRYGLISAVPVRDINYLVKEMVGDVK